MSKPLSILFVSSEIYPFAKTGGLADVSYSLPLALRDLGHDIRVMMPKYGSISERKNRIHEINRLKDIPITVGEETSYATVKSSSVSNPRTKVQAYITTNSNYFDAKKGFYHDPITGEEYSDNDERFIFYSKTVLQTCLLLGWFPDIIHCNDWQTALIPAYVRELYPDEFANTKIIYTVHNFANQGVFSAEAFAKTDLPDHAAENLTHNGKLNFMKAGLHYADMATTVSPSYAKEILEQGELSNGLHEALLARADKITGIVHGVDMLTWNPEIDSRIAKKYTAETPELKVINKEALLKKFNLPFRSGTPLIGMISRLNDQKGVQLVLDAAERLFAFDIQFVLLGDGESAFKEQFAKFPERFPGKAGVSLGFDDDLAHLIEAGSDMFLMPSLFEPCGLNQQYSLVYGSIPIVRATGGLKDTVTNYDESTGAGFGFMFEEYSAEAMLNTVGRALNVYARRGVWQQLVAEAMSIDLSWKNSAKKYSEMYHNLM